jgi:hypothetical protein
MESLADVHDNGDPYVWGNPKSSDVPAAGMFVPPPSAGRGELDPEEGGPVAV